MPRIDGKSGEVYFSVAEIAERWGCSIDTVLYRDLEKGNLRSTRTGRAHWVSAADLEAYEERLKLQLQKEIKVRTLVLERLRAHKPTALRPARVGT